MLLGDLWRPIEPWTAPVTATRRLLGRTGSVGLARLGHWPAVLGLLAFAWFEIVSLAPDDPPTLARAIALYWLAIFALAVLEGPAVAPPGRSPHPLLPLRLEDRPPLARPGRSPHRALRRPAGRPDPRDPAALAVSGRLRHPDPRHRHLRRPAPYLLVAHPPGAEPARVPRPLRRHRREHLRPPRRVGADRRRHPRHRRPRPPPRPRTPSGRRPARRCSRSCPSPPATTPPTT